ncbi:hypothetical protein EDC04DRAFT_272751 [Pisolithus marmoratus]|nr:hypothetical protein EDC04DRAFT_272751 [Pisolithus marmoratus]
MFKQSHRSDSPGYVPRTPKFTKLSLPPVETGSTPSRSLTRAGTRPPVPAMPPNNPRANPTSGQASRPLRPILKRPGISSVPAHTSYDSEGEVLTSKKVVRSHDAHRYPPPPQAGVRRVTPNRSFKTKTSVAFRRGFSYRLYTVSRIRPSVEACRLRFR